MRIKNIQNKKIRILLRIASIILLLLILSFSLFSVDTGIVNNNRKPMFAVRYDTMNDGGSSFYIGLGYQIITWKKLTHQTGVYNVGVETHYLLGINLFSMKPTVPLHPVQFDEVQSKE